MKYLIILLVFCFSFSCFSQGQVEANDIAHQNWSNSLKIKDSLVVELLKINSTDTTYISTFNTSEKLWESFVEGQFRLKFPEYESWETRKEIYGSQFDMLYYQFMKFYCDLRIATLYDLIEE
ncbi:hypothetical protein [Winogradskyella rapida]|uniref:Uncharacterized protein n=1 Tax=Winogradskyella rapida TaxID=549701 RepID=A0ABW3KW80_9FLAO